MIHHFPSPPPPSPAMLQLVWSSVTTARGLVWYVDEKSKEIRLFNICAYYLTEYMQRYLYGYIYLSRAGRSKYGGSLCFSNRIQNIKQ
ncbi:hypothetical protein BX666DRAFT_1392444 [Dichotomocladium elegans]|nr:hypothetical protein BX666DRAFT_1392444 [Dichotomocladium elegans]